MRNVTVRYPNGVQALTDLNVDIAAGEFVFVIGRTGSGKSTFARLIYREVAPVRGTVEVAGEDVTSLPAWRVPLLRRKVGVVFQDFRLLPRKTAFENVAFALQVIGAPLHAIYRQVSWALTQVGLSGKADAYPDQLSGGEQQRVCIARAIVNNPLILVADEPTGDLDPDTSGEIVYLLKHINETQGTTVVIATHDKYIVDLLRTRILGLADGRLVRDEKGTYDHAVVAHG
ncbi:MAG TPA: ATP-binding cassette domain-containing protein [Armatimonadetes bacterium]|nr:ATP-binding cassette domain-containing protein [Armatimonadota bacterium]